MPIIALNQSLNEPLTQGTSSFCLGEGNRTKDLLSAFQSVPGDTGVVRRVGVSAFPGLILCSGF